jgi:formylglycine-generating enzyme required for sulfatase activity
MSATSVSAYSNIASGMIDFASPTNLRLISLSASEVRVEWQDNTTIETAYEVQISTDGTNFSQLALLGPGSTGVTVAGSYIEGKTYSFRARALRTKNSTINYSAFSNVALGGVIDAAGIDWVAVDGGSFTMGTNGGQSDEQPETSVRLDNYKISRTEITFDQYHQFCLDSTAYTDPSDFGWGGGTRPVINVSWEDASAFCRWATAKTGKTVRLPTEAEWEFACRGGNSSGNFNYSGSNMASVVAWTYENSSSKTQPVGSKQVNELGIYDMSGNVWEWCSDWYGQYPGGSVVNPTGPATGTTRVLRGGSWFSFSKSASVYSRIDGAPTSGSYDVGFRVVKTD